MVGCSCRYGAKFEGLSVAYKRALWAVIAINAIMFLVEMSAGLLSGSQALKADALDFLGDTTTYAISLFVIGMPLIWRARAALFKGLSLGAMGLWVLGSTLYQTLVLGLPRAERQYFHFGEPIGTGRFAGLHEDRDACFELRKEVQRAIEHGVGALLELRDRDPGRYPVQRLLRAASQPRERPWCGNFSNSTRAFAAAFCRRDREAREILIRPKGRGRECWMSR